VGVVHLNLALLFAESVESESAEDDVVELAVELVEAGVVERVVVFEVEVGGVAVVEQGQEGDEEDDIVSEWTIPFQFPREVRQDFGL